MAALRMTDIFDRDISFPPYKYRVSMTVKLQWSKFCNFKIQAVTLGKLKTRVHLPEYFIK